MLNRWLARFKIDPDTLRQQKWFALFGERLLTPALWQGGTRALCGAVAAGLFASWVPMPMHSLVAVARMELHNEEGTHIAFGTGTYLVG